MMMKILTTLLLIFTAAASTAQQAEGKKNIEKLCGCFDVEFRYAETFAPDTAYQFHKRELLSGTELVLPVETSDNKIVLQHLLVAFDTMVIKHWREDWTFEQPDLLVYEGDKQWKKAAVPAAELKNTWAQTVWEVDDAPRYQGQSQWLYADGKTVWMNTTNAPLPRREYSVRKDYNILKRGNRIIINDNGWSHEQDNEKIIKNGSSEQLLVEEKGLNIYTKAPDSKCAVAKKWWAENGGFWAIVRAGWDEYVQTHTNISLKAKVDGKSLDQNFFDLAKQWKAKKISKEQVTEKVKLLVKQFADPDGHVAAN
jgi:hypothetical protein